MVGERDEGLNGGTERGWMSRRVDDGRTISVDMMTYLLIPYLDSAVQHRDILESQICRGISVEDVLSSLWPLSPN